MIDKMQAHFTCGNCRQDFQVLQAELDENGVRAWDEEKSIVLYRTHVCKKLPVA